MRSRSISPSTSIRSSNSEDSDDTSRYASMSAEELSSIWERRNLAYFDRRQRKKKLAEERQQQQQQQQQQQDLSGGDDSLVAYNSSSSNSSGSAHEQLGAEFATLTSSSSPQPQQLTRPAGYVCAADDPQWQAFTSHNIMGDYDPERASREPAYHDAWVSCERLVNMRRSGATTAAAGNFIPTNPRLAALLEHRRLEVARERYEQGIAALQRQHQISLGAQQQHDNNNNNMMLEDDYSASQEPSPFTSLSAQQAAEQAAEYERLNQAHRAQQQNFAAHAQGNNTSNLKTPSIENNAGEKSVQMPVKNSYYMALPYPTPQLPKSVYCDRCNCELFTSLLAKRFFCQACGSVAKVSVSSNNVDASFDEKMQDAEDHDYQNMSYY